MFSLRALQGRSKVTFSLEGSESIVVSEAYQVIEDSSSSPWHLVPVLSFCVCVHEATCWIDIDFVNYLAKLF